MAGWAGDVVVAATAALPEVGKLSGLLSLPETMPHKRIERRYAVILVAQERYSEPLNNGTRWSTWEEDMLLLFEN